MAYTRREVTDGVTVMNKDLYDNVQDGIDEAKKANEDTDKEVKSLQKSLSNLLVLSE